MKVDRIEPSYTRVPVCPHCKHEFGSYPDDMPYAPLLYDEWPTELTCRACHKQYTSTCYKAYFFHTCPT